MRRAFSKSLLEARYIHTVHTYIYTCINTYTHIHAYIHVHKQIYNTFSQSTWYKCPAAGFPVLLPPTKHYTEEASKSAEFVHTSVEGKKKRRYKCRRR